MFRFEFSMSADDYAMPAIPTNRASKAAISIVIDTDNFTWASAIITLEWTIADPLTKTNNLRDAVEQWNTFSNTIVFNTTTQFLDRISVSSVPLIRLRVTTPETGTTGDPRAIALIHLS